MEMFGRSLVTTGIYVWIYIIWNNIKQFDGKFLFMFLTNYVSDEELVQSLTRTKDLLEAVWQQNYHGEYQLIEKNFVKPIISRFW